MDQFFMLNFRGVFFLVDGSDVPQKETAFVCDQRVTGHWSKGRFFFMLLELIQV